MSKLIFNPDVKILKSCKLPEISVNIPCEPSLCPSFPAIENENFLENVDQDILFFDDSIEIEETSRPSVAEDEGKEMHIKFAEQSRPTCTLESPISSDDPQTNLGVQISLPFDEIESLFFYEVLMISKESRSNSVQKVEFRLIPRHNEIEEFGSACLMADGLDDGNIMVYITTHMTDDRDHVTEEILTVVKTNLQTVHEKIVSRSCVGGQMTEKTLHIIAENNGGFRMIKTETKDGKTEQSKCNIEWTLPGDYLSSGANVLLTRRLVINKFEGCIHSWNCDLDGEFSLSQQWFQKPETVVVTENPHEVQRINRLLISANGHVSKHSSYYHSGTGCLLKEIYANTSMQIHLNPFSEIPPMNCIKDLHLNWESDLQLMSMYLEFKEKRKEELKQQLEHPRMKSILCDYIMCLVKNKPKSVMNFTLDFVRKLERDGNVQVYQTAGRRHQQNSI